MKKLTSALLSVMMLFGLVSSVAVPMTVSASPLSDACDGLKAAGNGGCDANSGGSSFSTIIKRVISLLSIVVGAVSVIMIIIGGLRYVLSNGDSNSTKGAKDTILYALVGLVVVLFAQVIVRFVLTNVK